MTTTPPGPAVSGLAALRRFRRDPIGLLEEAATYGDVSALRLPRFPVVLLNHPDLVRDVLVGSNRSFRKGPTMQAALLLATIGRRWQLDAEPGAGVELQPVVTLRPLHGVPMTARARPGRAA